MLSSRIIISVFFISVSGCFAFAQNKELSEAEDLFNNKNFSSALPIYLRLLKLNPAKSDLNYKIGICYINSRSQKIKAVQYFETAIQSNSNESASQNITTNGNVILYKLLGDAYCYANKFEPAIESYKKYKATLILTKDSGTIKVIDSKIKTCRIGKELRQSIALPLAISSQNFFGVNNTQTFSGVSTMANLSPASDINSIIPDGDQRKVNEDQIFYEKLSFSSIVDSTNSKSKHSEKFDKSNDLDTIAYATNVGSSVDGQTVLTYKNEKGSAGLFIARLKKDHWSAPEKLNKTVNLNGWENNEFISADGNTMYFTSDRAGGFGGKDIYSCTKIKNGEWSKAINLGPVINSKYNDEAPFIHPDGVTLFFSSDRNKPGSFDIFTATLADSNNWGQLTNVGYPVNRNNESFFQVLSEKKVMDVDAEKTFDKNNNSKRDTGKLNIAEEKDNFLITFIDQKKLPLTLLKNEVQNLKGDLALQAEIMVTDNFSGEVLGIFHSDNKTGHYAIIIPPGKNNNVTYLARGYLFQSENVDVNKEKSYFQRRAPIKMPALAKGASVTLNNIFFDSAKATFHRASDTELKRVLNLFYENAGIKVEISNYIFSKKNKRSNKKLSRSRADAVKNYLVNNGINKENVNVKGYRKAPRIPSKKMNISELPALADQKIELKIIELK